MHSALKFPNTRNGKAILAEEKYKSRIELVEGPTFPSLDEEYGNILGFYGFNQFKHKPDFDGSSVNYENKSTLSQMQFLSYIGSLKPDAHVPILCIWFYHKASKTLIYEHNFEIYLSEHQLSEAPFVLRMMVKPNNFASCGCNQDIPCVPIGLENCKMHCEQMKPIVDLDVRGMMEFHSDLGVMSRCYETKAEFKEDFTKVLKKSGEDDPTGETMYKKQTSSKCTIS